MLEDPSPQDHAEFRRLEALDLYEVLDTPVERAFDDLTQLACRVFGMPLSAISLVDASRQWFKSQVGLGISETPRAVAFCDFTIRGHEVMVVPDAAADQNFAANPLVTGAPHLGFYAGAPLVTPDGQAIGSLCVLDHRPRSFDAQQCETLAAMARQVIALLELRRRNRELATERKRLGDALHHQTLSEQRAVTTLQATQALMHELQVYKIEVEAQNDELRRVTDEIESARSRLFDLYDLAPVGYCTLNQAGLVREANLAAATLLGLESSALTGEPLTRFIAREDQDRFYLQHMELAQSGRPQTCELRMVNAAGSDFWAELSVSYALGADNAPELRVVLFDTTERRRADRALQDGQKLLDKLAQRVPGVLYQYRMRPDGSSFFPYVSPGLLEIYELSPEEVREDARRLIARRHPEDHERVNASIQASMQTLEDWRLEYRVVLPIKGERWLQVEARPDRLDDGTVEWHGFISDITWRKEIEARTHKLAHYDELTGLPNRRLFSDRLSQALVSAQRSGQYGAILFVDLDNFKEINDARGHRVGDHLLREVAKRLSGELRRDDSVARLGGDEFVVLAGNLGASPALAADRAGILGAKLCRLIETPCEFEGLAYGSSGSIGITVFPMPDQTLEDLLRQADIAMYRAKNSGGNRFAFFESGMQTEVEEHLRLRQDLQGALARGELDIHLQPQFDGSEREVGGELLLRWTHPARGAVSPASFIPLAESSGLIVPIGDWVIRQACEALVRMQQAGRLVPLSVNVSPRQFRNDDFVGYVRATLAATGAPAAQLIFEVTESLLIENWTAVQARMLELVALGIRFSIDDFGTGYSSLGYLKKLPLYELKIDGSFVRDLPSDASDTAIVQSILSVAQHLGLRVVAECVETRAQANYLLSHRCDSLQGFLLGRPRSFAQWLDARCANAAPPL